MKISDYISNTRTTFARFALSLGIRTLLPDTFEYIPYLLENASEARREINDMLKSSKKDAVTTAQKFLDDIKSNQKFILEDKTYNLSALYSEWENLLGEDIQPKTDERLEQVIADSVECALKKTEHKEAAIDISIYNEQLTAIYDWCGDINKIYKGKFTEFLNDIEARKWNTSRIKVKSKMQYLTYRLQYLLGEDWYTSTCKNMDWEKKRCSGANINCMDDWKCKLDKLLSDA